MKLTRTEKQKTPYKFFFDNAGYSYDPKKETELQGRRRCAKAYAEAEARAIAEQVDFEWIVDPGVDSSEFSDEKPAWKLWGCMMRRNGRVCQSLWGIDFGRNGEPWNDTYKRVVEAELACEEFGL